VKRTNIYTTFFLLSAVLGFFRLVSDTPIQSNNKRYDVLTTEQLALFLPDELKSFKRNRLRQVPKEHKVISNYGADEFVLTIQDAAKDNYKGIEEFNDTYYKTSLSETLIRFPKVRSGFRTITEIRDEATIAFVFNERFIITISGLNNQTPTRLWTYLELSKLRPLDRFH